MPEGSPGAGTLKCGRSFISMQRSMYINEESAHGKQTAFSLCSHMGKRSRVTRYVIIRALSVIRPDSMKEIPAQPAFYPERFLNRCLHCE